MNLLKIFVFPLAILYGIITFLRNKLFDWGIFPSQSYDFPVIGVGNLSVGGTGKTPMIEYIVGLLISHKKIAVLSRGYKRKSTGFQIAENDATVEKIGDEPLQIFSKFKQITVAVCNSRRTGIKEIMERHPATEAILLDDAFQHRYVKPGLNILLTDYHRIFTRSYMLPTGNLREYRSGVKRADILVITKTPSVFSPLDRKLILQELKKYEIRNIFFSYLGYGKWIPLTSAAKKSSIQKVKTIFLITGIANPVPLSEHLKRECTEFKLFRFPDHHQFTAREIQNVVKTYHDTYSGSKVLITTEKDSMRMRSGEILKLLDNVPLFQIPIEIKFHDQDKHKFDTLIMDFTDKYQPKQRSVKKKKAIKSKIKTSQTMASINRSVKTTKKN